MNELVQRDTFFTKTYTVRTHTSALRVGCIHLLGPGEPPYEVRRRCWSLRHGPPSPHARPASHRGASVRECLLPRTWRSHPGELHQVSSGRHRAAPETRARGPVWRILYRSARRWVGNTACSTRAPLTCHKRADDGHVFQWGTLYNLVYPSPTPVLFPGGHTVVQLAAGDKHVLAVTQTGFCFAWGCGLFGRLGLGSHESHRTPQPVPVGNKANIVRVGCGAAHSGAVTGTLPLCMFCARRQGSASHRDGCARRTIW